MFYNTATLLDSADYAPGKVLDEALYRLNLKNDRALASLLDLTPPVISKIRTRRMPMSSAVLLRLHEATQIPVTDLRKLMGA